MSYATPDQLRARFRKGIDQDEFALRDDADLQQALDAATNEIDSYRPAGVPAPEALVVLADKCLMLARMLVNQDQALGAEHPIVRDGNRVLGWLKDLSRGAVHLPTGAGDSGGTGASWSSTPTVFGRRTGGGL